MWPYSVNSWRFIWTPERKPLYISYKYAQNVTYVLKQFTRHIGEYHKPIIIYEYYNN